MRTRLTLSLVASLFVLGLGISPWASGSLFGGFLSSSSSPSEVAASPLQSVPNQRTSDCGGVITATVLSSTVPACNETEITVDVEPECPVCIGGITAIFVLLEQSQQADWQSSESVRILDEIERYTREYDPETINLGVITYNASDAREVQRLTNNFTRVRGALNSPSNGYIAQGDAERAANQAVRMLRDARRGANVGDPSDRCELVVMFAHVKEHDSHASNLERAGQIMRRELRSGTYLVGCPIETGQWYCEGPEPEMPHSRRDYSKYPEGGQLLNVARNTIRGWEEGDVAMRSLDLEQVLPPGLAYVQGSASISPTSITAGDGMTLTWTWEPPDASDPQSVKYRVKPLSTGTYSVTGHMRVMDTARLLREVPLEPVPVINADVDDCPLETPVPSPTFTSTPRPTATPTATEVPPTLTPTPGHYIIYLPIMLGEECFTRKRHADIVLVLDVSTSMQRETEAGRTKIAAMQDAAGKFLDRLALEPDETGGYDQVAIVGFNRDAWIQQALTSERADLDAAVAALPDLMREYTRLDLALLRGLEALEVENRHPENLGVIVLLTDGLPNQVPVDEDGTMETTVLKAAREAKAAGATIYAVGLGNPESPDLIDRINPDLLREIASNPRNYFETLDAEALSYIYSEIAISIGCPRGRHSWMEPWP